MPMTVITISNSTNSLRGDLSKWMQEIATGVYIGNFNTKIRDRLWDRVKRDIGKGYATLSYRVNNEIGYEFKTYRTNREIIRYDGIPLVLISNACENQKIDEVEFGFSNSYKNRKIKKIQKYKNNQKKLLRKKYIVLKVFHTDESIITQVMALKVNLGDIENEKLILNFNVEQSKIENEYSEGILKSLSEFITFIEDLPIIGYSLRSDIDLLNIELVKVGRSKITNNKYDILRFVKKHNMFINDYKFGNVIKEYGVEKKDYSELTNHVDLIYELANKVNGFLETVL